MLLFFLNLDEQITTQCALKSTIFEEKFSPDMFLKGRLDEDEDDEPMEAGELGELAGDEVSLDEERDAEDDMLNENSLMHLMNSEGDFLESENKLLNIASRKETNYSKRLTNMNH